MWTFPSHSVFFIPCKVVVETEDINETTTEQLTEEVNEVIAEAVQVSQKIFVIPMFFFIFNSFQIEI